MDIIVKSKLVGLILAFSIIFFGLESSYSILLFLIIMLSIGIPHGSVDHIIAFINPNASAVCGCGESFTVKDEKFSSDVKTAQKKN